MAQKIGRVRLVQSLAKNKTHSVDLDLPSHEDIGVDYYLRFERQRSHLRISVSTRPEDRVSSAAVLRCCPTLVELQGLQSDVYVEGTSWNSDRSSKSPEKRSLSAGACNFQLRPNDTFYIGDTKLVIRSDSTVRSSILDPESSPPPAPPASQPRRLRPGATIMETPSKDLGSAQIIKTLTSNALRGNEDSEHWPTDSLKRSTLFGIRESTRQHESSPGPASEGPQIPAKDVTPSKVVCQDSVDPRNLEYQHFLETGRETTESPTAPSQRDTQIKDESQVSNVKHADRLLSIAGENQPPSSPVWRSAISDLADAAEDADQVDTMFEQNDANPPVTDVGVGNSILEPRILDEVAMQGHEDANDVNRHDSNGIHLQAAHESHPAAATEVQSRMETDDSPERGRKRVKFAHDHDVSDTVEALKNPDADVTTDEERPENESPEKPDAGAAANGYHKLSERTRRHSSDPSPASPNDQTAKTTPQLRGKSASPSILKKPATSKRTPKPRKSLTTSERPLEPSSSNRSKRSATRDATAKPQDSATVIQVLFASSTTMDTSKAFMKFLSAHGVQTATSINDCTILCVGKDAELKKTSNLILAVLTGKSVIADSWISDSVNAKELLDYEDYKATDPSAEEEWGTTLVDAIARGKEGLKPFIDWSFCFTPAIKTELGKGFADIKTICLEAGAKSIQATLPRKGPQEPCRTIMIATGNDKDTGSLHEKGWKTYSKDIITLSALRGSLQLESEEFEIQAKKSPPQTGKGKTTPQTGKSKTPQTGNSKKRKR